MTIKNVAKRLLPLRNAGGGLLGGRTLVALHYATGLVLAKHAVADGDAKDSRFVPDLMAVIQEHIKGLLLWLADRGFCDLNRFEYFTKDGNHSLVRYHKKNGFHLDADRKVLKGKDEQGRCFLQFSFCLLLYNVMQTISSFVAKNQKRECESISIENLFLDTREELATLSVLIRWGVIRLDDIPPRQDNLQSQLNDLLKNQWSDRWIKAKNKNRRPHVPHSGKRTHSSVFRFLHPELQRC